MTGRWMKKRVTLQVSPLLDSSLPTAVRQGYRVSAGCAACTHSIPLGEPPQAASSLE